MVPGLNAYKRTSSHIVIVGYRIVRFIVSFLKNSIVGSQGRSLPQGGRGPTLRAPEVRLPLRGVRGAPLGKC